MENHKQNGSPLQKNLAGSDQEEITGRIKVLVHQDALDIPEHSLRKDIVPGERPHFLPDAKSLKRRPSLIVEPDDIITPLSEESSPTVTGKQWDDKPSVENYDTDDGSCYGRVCPCCGDLIDPGSMTLGRLLGLLTNLAFYVGNLASDFAVCYLLFSHGNMLWFALVAAFTIIPTVILNSISYHLSISKMLVKRSIWNQSESFLVSVIVALLHLSQFGVAARYLGYLFLHELEYLWVIFCPNEKRKDFDHHSGKYVELPYLPYLFMVEAMLQCLPQLLIQLYILIKGEDTLSQDINQMLIISVIVSLLNLTRLITTCKHVQKNFTTPWSGLFFIYMWYLFTNVSRIISLSLFMTKFLLGFFMLCLFHWIIMSIWAVSVLTPSVPCFTVNGFRKNCSKYFKGFLYGIIYLLCFMELKIMDDSEGPNVPSRYLYVFFYSVMLLENTVVIILWYVYSSSAWYSVYAIVATFLTFLTGIFFMYIYYRYFHKNVINHSDRWKCVMLFPARNRVG
ncbi:XK-related protein 4 like protein [Argiope bruennichi]|uniref:XK-related protein n=1 Tax=Argiope bruennichi TaxID=94029 RepID=A0A8T0F3L6_ARGBR|nr:XK-related protein 4 like protein [Argiope bruennichi]